MRRAILAAAFAAFLVTNAASAAPVVGGTTRISLIGFAFFDAFGIGLAPTGGATLDTTGDTPLLSLPITAVSPAGIDHAGSGIEFAFPGFGGPVVLSDLRFDEAGAQVQGMATLPGFGAAFKLADLLPGGFVAISQDLAGVLVANNVPNAVFLGGLVIGILEDTPATPVSEPAALALLGIGLAGLAGLRRRIGA